MTTPHKATPEQWEHIEQRILAIDPGCSCILELRSRIEALEAAANAKPTSNSSQIRSSPAGELLERVSAAICTIADCGDTPSNWAPEARAAILAVAGWWEHRKPAALHCAALLREEVQHRG